MWAGVLGKLHFMEDLGKAVMVIFMIAFNKHVAVTDAFVIDHS